MSSLPLSGVLHAAAGVASGSPLDQLGVFRFFCTQTLGVILGQGFVTEVRKLQGKHRTSSKDDSRSPWSVRTVGYA
jgi:hypothetical protein